MVEDVSQARVRVSQSRLKKLKARISKLDREIQELSQEIEHHRYYGEFWILFGVDIKKLIAKRQMLDLKRKDLRLEAKGYGKQRHNK